MRFIAHTFSIVVLFIFLMGCKSEEPEINEYLQLLKGLEGSYRQTSIVKDNYTMENWKNFGLDLHLVNDSTFSYFAYNIPSDSISQLTWPTNGYLTLRPEEVNYWVRDDGISMVVNFDSTLFFMFSSSPFEAQKPCNGICPITGIWTFQLEKRD
ncbi:MAG: hypothetical protein RIA69_11560 [Cyclobacteriaceae bacterium]